MTFIFITAKNSSPSGRDLTEDLTMFAHVKSLDLEAGTAEQTNTVAAQTDGRTAQVRRPTKITVNYNMVFTWQAPMGLMAYSAIGFIIGLMVYVTTPLYDGSAFGGDSKVSGSSMIILGNRCLL